jgi:phosphate transport system substrate-binding protein
MRKTVKALAFLAAVVIAVPVVAQVKVDSALPDYRAVSGVSGNISSVGSDTLNNLLTYWAENFG